MNPRAWFRSVCYGVIKLVPIIATIGLAGLMILSRSQSTFPMGAGPLIVLRAVCFEQDTIDIPAVTKQLQEEAAQTLKSHGDAMYWTSGTV